VGPLLPHAPPPPPRPIITPVHHSRAKGGTGAGYDLNRNFPDHFASSGADLRQPTALTQPEVRAVMAFSLGRTWLAAANFHEGDLVSCVHS
jgi:hypothetical protein